MVFRKIASAAGALGLAVTLGWSGAAASAAPAPSKVAWVRAAHLSPDTPKVDVYLTAFSGGSTKLWLAGVGYGDFSGYRRMPAGQYAVSMRPHGAAVTTAAALSWTVTLQPGQAYTAAAFGQHGQLHGTVYDDRLTPPAKGTGYVRIIQGSARAGALEATAGGQQIANGTAYGAISSYAKVPAGTATVQVSSQANSKLTATLHLSVASQSVTSVVVLDKRGGGLVLSPHVDAAGAQQPPVGAVPAGGGGTARSTTGAHGPESLAALLAAAGLVLLVAAFVVRRREVV
jgi:hypothetical protein